MTGMMPTIARYAPWAVLAATGGFVLAAFAILTGLWPISPGSEEHVVDMALVTASLGHAALGTVIALLLLGSGAGLLSLLDRRKSLGPLTLLLFGFPPGLTLWTLVAFLGGLGLPGTLLGLTILAALSAVFIVRFRKSEPEGHFTVFRYFIVPLAIGYGAWMGLIQHGPTDTLTAYPIMDLLHYVTNIYAIDAGGWPPPDLNYAGEHSAVFNLLWSGIGASTLDFVEIDPFLFIVSGGQAAFVIFTAVSVYAFAAHVRLEGAAPRLLLLLALLTATYFPGWITNSPPVLYVNALTLAFAALLLDTRNRLEAGEFRWADMLALGALAILGPALTKVTLFGLFAPFAGLIVLMNWRALPQTARIGAIGLMAVGLAGGLAVVIAYWQDMQIYLQPAAWSWIWYSNGYTGMWPILLREISALIVGVGFVWLRPGLASLGLLALLALSLFFPALLIVVTGAAGAFAVAYWHREFAGKPWPTALIVLGFSLAMPKAVFGDPAGWAPAIGWLAGVGAAVFVVQLMGGSRFRNAAISVGAMTGLLVLCLAAGSGQIPFRSGYWYPVSGYEGITPNHRDIWQTARRCLPRDALIFTDGEGPEFDLQNHWNLYAQSGGRQVFIAGVGQTFGPLRRPEELDQRRVLNSEVLSGATDPETLELPRRYSLFARIARSEAPEGWSMIHANETFSLSVYGEASPDVTACVPAEITTRR
jgi:hypothetical protein